MNNRIKAIRKKLAMTADDFSSKLAVSRTAITNIETGARQPSNQLINSICREFDVNEHWLRTGEGEMFNELSRDEQITRFVAKVLKGDDAFKRSVILALSEMPDEFWPLWAEFIMNVAEKQKQQNQSGQPPDSD